MKTKFSDVGRCLVCLKNPCQCKTSDEVWDEAVNRCKCRCHLPLVTTHFCPNCFNGCPRDNINK